MSRLGFLIDRLIIKQPRFRSAITRLLFGSDDREVDLLGHRFLVNSLRENGYVRAARRAGFSSLFRDEASVIISLSAVLRPGDTFVDVGANIGLFCCLLTRMNRLPTTPPVRFYAYEPHPDTFRRLQVNASRAGVISRNLAVSDKEGELEFVDGAVSHVFTRADRASAYNIENDRSRVRAVRLACEPVEGNSIVLKIDVEGQEMAVLEGAREWFESRRVKAVYLDGFRDEDTVEDFLRRFDFELLNGRSMEPFWQGEFSLLAVDPTKL